ncbi:hypothetical protein HUT06_09665 [Actinomadura sp. NAK00032]|uniref:hypothetical protein n=1 Tax=Actinomadura sp. NAK00032 TaxID=2742128 RepID=UPI001590C127|nr:hypothetical protein [Actinomadura sp. NAK00032]QKW34262.1 hypothetical protein HUT06_09665 [Actinomadura sp. NAK00032]
MTEFAATMSHINQQTQKVTEKLNELVANVNRVLAKLPSFISDRVVPLLDKLRDAVVKMWNEFANFVAEPGDWGKLADAAKKFSDNVQGPVSAQAGYFQESYSKVDDYWEGDAAKAYKKVLKPDAPQSGATEQYADTAKAVSDAAGWGAVQVMGGAASTFRTENNGNNKWPGGQWPPSGVVTG